MFVALFCGPIFCHQSEFAQAPELYNSMLLPSIAGVVWFCAIQYVPAPLPPAHHPMSQDCHPVRCSIFVNTTASAGGVGRAPVDGAGGVGGVVGVVGAAGADGMVGVVGAVGGVAGAVVVAGVADVADALCERNPLPQPAANNNVRVLSTREAATT